MLRSRQKHVKDMFQINLNKIQLPSVFKPHNINIKTTSVSVKL